jgi:hypothetical protein
MFVEEILLNGIQYYVWLMDSKTDMYLPYDPLQDLNKYLEHRDACIFSGVLNTAISPNVLR